MNTVRLGKTEIVVNKNGFGALPIQRISDEEAVKIVRTAYDRGVTFFDTARFYTDSEHKLGLALSDVRSQVYISSKTAAVKPEDFWQELAEKDEEEAWPPLSFTYSLLPLHI